MVNFLWCCRLGMIRILLLLLARNIQCWVLLGEEGRNGRLHHVVEVAEDQNGKCVEEFAVLEL
jgi:hypothetical protein